VIFGISLLISRPTIGGITVIGQYLISTSEAWED